MARLAMARFFARRSKASTIFPRTITLDGYAASHRAVRELKADGLLPAETKLRSSKYLNNLIEQDHRGVKQRIATMLGFKGASRPRRLRSPVSNSMHRIRKGQFGLDVWGVQGRLAPQCGMPCSKLEVSTVQHGRFPAAGYLHQSHRDHPLAADLLRRASVMILPIALSPLAEIVPTWAISSEDSHLGWRANRRPPEPAPLGSPGRLPRDRPQHPQSADTFYVGNMKGVGRIYPANLHRHTYAKVAFAKRKTPIKFQLLHLMTMTPHAFADDLLFFLRARSRRGHRE